MRRLTEDLENDSVKDVQHIVSELVPDVCLFFRGFSTLKPIQQWVMF